MFAFVDESARHGRDGLYVVAAVVLVDDLDAARVAVRGVLLPRQPVAVARALAIVGEGEHATAIARLVDDSEPLVARAAADALNHLSRRSEGAHGGLRR